MRGQVERYLVESLLSLRESKKVRQGRQYKDRMVGINDLKPVLKLRIESTMKARMGVNFANRASDYLALVGEWGPTKRGSGQPTTWGPFWICQCYASCRRQTYSN